MAEANRDGERGTLAGQASPSREGRDISNASADTEPVASFPNQSPLFHAQQADRYQRQALVREYESEFDCRLAIVSDAIFPDSVTLFEDLLFDADPVQDLHLVLHSPGGDGETAVRLARQAQSRCRDFVVIVPDQAKSAATLLAMGAHRILMGPTSDLGPVDPQFQLADGSSAHGSTKAATPHRFSAWPQACRR